jgi:hypothetical protein
MAGCGLVVFFRILLERHVHFVRVRRQAMEETFDRKIAAAAWLAAMEFQQIERCLAPQPGDETCMQSSELRLYRYLYIVFTTKQNVSDERAEALEKRLEKARSIIEKDAKEDRETMKRHEERQKAAWEWFDALWKRTDAYEGAGLTPEEAVTRAWRESEIPGEWRAEWVRLMRQDREIIAIMRREKA